VDPAVDAALDPVVKHTGNASGLAATAATRMPMNRAMSMAVNRMMLRKSRTRAYSSSEASYAVSMACLSAARRTTRSGLRNARSAWDRRGSVRSITTASRVETSGTSTSTSCSGMRSTRKTFAV
jgi:hypothetical protein